MIKLFSSGIFGQMNYKIAAFGSSAGTLSSSLVDKARVLGKALGHSGVDVITGAGPGLPYEVAVEAYKNGSSVFGYSPEVNLKGQKNLIPDADLTIYKKIFYMPKNFPFLSDSDVCKKYRNVISTANCDAGIIISGRWGTMNEFTNLYDMGKVIGVLTGTGGIADELDRLNKKIYKPGKAKVMFSKSPQRLVKMIIAELEKRAKS